MNVSPDLAGLADLVSVAVGQEHRGRGLVVGVVGLPAVAGRRLRGAKARRN